MKVLLAYVVALILAIFNGKLVAGAISGIVLTPVVKPVEHLAVFPRYVVPFLQGIAMGIVATCTAKWLLGWFGLKMTWLMVGIIVTGFVAVDGNLMKKAEERDFHLSAGVGELLGIVASSYYFLQLAI